MLTIYAMHFADTNCAYVGCTSQFQKRTRAHLNDAARGVHRNRNIQALFDRVGAQNVSFRVLQECPIFEGKDREAFWMNSIAKTFDLVNLKPATAAGSLGYRHSAEHRARLSSMRKGRKGISITTEHARKMNAAHGPHSQARREMARALGKSSGSPVRNKTTGEEFLSVTAAAAACGIHKSTIQQVLSGRCRTAAGCEWEYGHRNNSWNRVRGDRKTPPKTSRVKKRLPSI